MYKTRSKYSNKQADPSQSSPRGGPSEVLSSYKDNNDTDTEKKNLIYPPQGKCEKPPAMGGHSATCEVFQQRLQPTNSSVL